jgi:hypothetical protein
VIMVDPATIAGRSPAGSMRQYLHADYAQRGRLIPAGELAWRRCSRRWLAVRGRTEA